MCPSVWVLRALFWGLCFISWVPAAFLLKVQYAVWGIFSNRFTFPLHTFYFCSVVPAEKVFLRRCYLKRNIPLRKSLKTYFHFKWTNFNFILCSWYKIIFLQCTFWECFQNKKKYLLWLYSFPTENVFLICLA